MIGNSVHIIGHITGDIYYDNFTVDSKATPFLRVMMVVQGASRRDPTPALRVVFYGRRAQIIEAFAQKGAKFYVEGHIQTRSMKDRTVVEIVGEHALALRHANWERGNQRIEELLQQDPNLNREYGTFIEGMQNPEEDGRFETPIPGFRLPGSRPRPDSDNAEASTPEAEPEQETA